MIDSLIPKLGNLDSWCLTLCGDDRIVNASRIKCLDGRDKPAATPHMGREQRELVLIRFVLGIFYLGRVAVSCRDRGLFRLIPGSMNSCRIGANAMVMIREPTVSRVLRQGHFIFDGSHRIKSGNATRIPITMRCAIKCGHTPQNTSVTGRFA
jgi:hypothetical protein